MTGRSPSMSNFQESHDNKRLEYLETRISNSKISHDYMKTQTTFLKTQEREFFDKFKNESIINKIFDNTTKLQKENKFLNQKNLIDAKFKNEDQILISKYATKFNLFSDNSKLYFRFSYYFLMIF